MLSSSRRYGKKTENEEEKGVYAGFEAGALKSLQNLGFPPSYKLNFFSQVRREWKQGCFVLSRKHDLPRFCCNR